MILRNIGIGMLGWESLEAGEMLKSGGEAALDRIWKVIIAT